MKGQLNRTALATSSGYPSEAYRIGQSPRLSPNSNNQNMGFSKSLADKMVVQEENEEEYTYGWVRTFLMAKWGSYSYSSIESIINLVTQNYRHTESIMILLNS